MVQRIGLLGPKLPYLRNWGYVAARVRRARQAPLIPRPALLPTVNFPCNVQSELSSERRRQCVSGQSDTVGIRASARGAQWTSSPSPLPLKHSVCIRKAQQRLEILAHPAGGCPWSSTPATSRQVPLIPRSAPLPTLNVRRGYISCFYPFLVDHMSIWSDH